MFAYEQCLLVTNSYFLWCSDVCLWTVPAGPGPPSWYMVWGSTVPGAVQQTFGRERGEMNLIIVKFNVHFCLKALKYFSNKAKLQLKQSHKSVFLPLPLRTWITQSCSAMRQLTSMNVPSGLFWKRTCFYTLLLLTMRRWGSITNTL